jgi:hypothetical protein
VLKKGPHDHSPEAQRDVVSYVVHPHQRTCMFGILETWLQTVVAKTRAPESARAHVVM